MRLVNTLLDSIAMVDETMENKMSKFTFVRLLISGALAGTALAGIFVPHFGLDMLHAKEIIGSIAGAGAVVAFKITHVI